jgi:hypothetical protein
MWDWWFFGYKKVVVSHEKIGRLIVLSKCYGWEKWRNEQNYLTQGTQDELY